MEYMRSSAGRGMYMRMYMCMHMYMHMYMHMHMYNMCMYRRVQLRHQRAFGVNNS